MKRRAVVVDDEPLAREQLLTLLSSEPDVEVVGEAGGGQAAIRLIIESRPDLVFLDVQMPGCDGFEVLRAISPSAPAVIFVTAYDKYAIDAFEVAAVDYLLKPLVESRFRAAVRRAVLRSREESSDTLATRMAELLGRLPAAVQQLPVWCDGRVVFVHPSEIDWIDAADDHVQLHIGKKTLLTRETMAAMETRLPVDFVRVHRSAIVNRARIREIQPWVKGDFVLILHDGTQVVSGRTYRERVRQLMSR
jgi:two-component system, LytTR family, response regulator